MVKTEVEMADERRLGKWMVNSPANSGVVEVLDSQSRELIATVHGDDFETKFQRALLIMTAPSLQETTRSAYWLFKMMGEHDPRIAEAGEEFLPSLEAALDPTGGVGENPLRK
jgi:hypothetical protein